MQGSNCGSSDQHEGGCRGRVVALLINTRASAGVELSCGGR